MLDRFRRESDREGVFETSWYLKPDGDAVVVSGFVPPVNEGPMALVWYEVIRRVFCVLKFSFFFVNPGGMIGSRSRIGQVFLFSVDSGIAVVTGGMLDRWAPPLRL